MNHLDEPNFQSTLNGMQQNGTSQDRLEDLHFDGFAVWETLFGNRGLDPDANFFQIVLICNRKIMILMNFSVSSRMLMSVKLLYLICTLIQGVFVKSLINLIF